MDRLGRGIYKISGALARAHRAVAPIVGAVRAGLARFGECVKLEFEYYKTLLSLYPAALKAVYRGDRTRAKEIRRRIWKVCKLYATAHSVPAISSPPTTQVIRGAYRVNIEETRKQLREELRRELQELKELGRGGENQ